MRIGLRIRNIQPSQGGSMSCQLTSFPALKVRNSWFNNLFQSRIKLLWSAKKKALFLKNKLLHLFKPKSKPRPPANAEQTKILPGDIVRVRSKEEIDTILDDWGGTRGCIFTPEMYSCCNRLYRTLKRVDYFYDEVKQKMCKCKNIYLLKGAVCSGRRRLFPESCDRNCFLFWHASWLEKVE